MKTQIRLSWRLFPIYQMTKSWLSAMWMKTTAKEPNVMNSSKTISNKIRYMSRSRREGTIWNWSSSPVTCTDLWVSRRSTRQRCREKINCSHQASTEWYHWGRIRSTIRTTSTTIIQVWNWAKQAGLSLRSAVTLASNLPQFYLTMIAKR